MIEPWMAKTQTSERTGELEIRPGVLALISRRLCSWKIRAHLFSMYPYPVVYPKHPHPNNTALPLKIYV